VKGLRVFLLIGSLIILMASIVMAQGELTGEEVLEQLKDDTTLTGSGSATIKLITENEKGQQRVHELKIFRKDDGEMEKQLLEYLEPADVRGTKFLSLNDAAKDENQMWLYLPALGRERRIAGHMTQDKFMGTDFTYEEIGGGQSYNEDYQASRLEDEEFEGYLCYVLDLVPEDPESKYSKVLMWVWQEELIPLKIQFYNLDGQLSKQLTSTELEKEEDGDYMPHRIVMSDELAGTRTIIEIIETSKEEVADDYFTMRYLRK
jgi:outer membrane lipoprotein-sorting protein